MNAASKTIAWNHVRLIIPSNWEIGHIDTRLLLFQDESTPTLELKWQTINGKFSHRAHLKRLAARNKTGLRQSVQAWQLPQAWQHALDGFTASGFSWAADASRGRGAILYCPTCRKATLIQFFDHATGRSHPAPQILETFRDHRDDGRTDWSVFDIRACLPEKFSLLEHRFQPGNFGLAFTDGRQRVALLRWAPASAFLNHQTLAQFAAETTHGDPAAFSAGVINGHPAVEAVRTPPNQKKRWFRRPSSTPLFGIRRFWHLVDKNRILGLTIESEDAVDTHLADLICGSYDSL